MSELAKHMLEELTSNKYGANILRTFKGRTAVKKAIDAFFNESTSKKEIEDWKSNWSVKDLSNAVFIEYERTKRTRKYIGFKFVVGDMETGSVLGEEHEKSNA